MSKKNYLEMPTPAETKAIVAWGKASKDADRKGDTMVTLFVKSDRKSTDFLTPLLKKDGTMKNPDSTSTPEFYHHVQDLLAQSFGKQLYKAWLIPNDTKGLTAQQKSDRNFAKKEVGARMGQISRRLKDKKYGGGAKSRQEIFSKRIADNIKLINDLQEGQWNTCPSDELKNLLSQINALLLKSK